MLNSRPSTLQLSSPLQPLSSQENLSPCARLLEDRGPRYHRKHDREISKRAPELTRDQRVEIRALRKYADMDIKTISRKIGCTQSQVQEALKRATPRAHRFYIEEPTGERYPCIPGRGAVIAGRPRLPRHKLIIKTLTRARILEFIHEDERHQKIPWQDLCVFISELFHFGTAAITSTIIYLGFRRLVQPRKIIRDYTNRMQRLSFCQMLLTRWPEPRDWLISCIIFSDETWALNDPMWKQYITIGHDENITDYTLKRRKPKGWMF